LSRARKVGVALGAAVLAAFALFFVLSRPVPVAVELPPDHFADPGSGEILYWAGGCLGCHRPEDGGGDDALPSGGAAFATPVGTFYPQNLTPDSETGIGSWTAAEFVTAMTRGLSPDGRHFFPAFPYTSYRRMPVEDLLDLRAYLMGLEPVRSPARPPAVPLPWLARRGVGVWKRVGLERGLFEPDPARDETWNRGAYLVNGPGHCGECHTPRNALMVMDEDRHLEGGPHPRGEGHVPDLTDLVGRGRYTDASDLTLALMYGETFGYDKLSSGGMAEVQMNLARLPEAEVRAIAEYLISLP
jgi:mono/diheme cytochrome c family protein